MQHKVKSISKIFSSIICTFFILFFPSPIISSIIGSSHSFIILPLGILLFFWSFIQGINKSTVTISLILIIWGLLSSLLSGSISQFGISFLIASIIIIADFIKEAAVEKKTVMAINKSMLIFLIGAWISIIYFFLNGSPVLTITNPDGRENNLFLTSFSNFADYEFWGIIRPSGIYDEPGALSFGVIITVIINELLNPRNKYSIIIMLLGLVTLSVAHALMTIIYLIYYIFKFSWKARLIILFFITAPFIIMGGTLPVDSVISLNFTNRFMIEDGRMRGDNRSNQIETFFEIAKNDVEISTRGHQAITNYSSTKRYAVDQSSNPFSMWFNYGFPMWIIYLISMLYILFLTIRHIKMTNIFIAGIMLFILLLQRPFIHDPGWGIAVWLSIALIRHAGQHFTNKSTRQKPQTHYGQIAAI